MSKFYNSDKNRNSIVSNHQIKFDTLRVLDKDKTALGIMTKDEALKLARSQGLDLVLIVEKAKPPVAKIIELSKYKYEQQKNEKEMAKKARAARIETKEVKFKPNIGEHDLLIKLKHAQEFLDNGAKVKITIQMRGRENANRDEVFKHFKEAIDSYLKNFKYDSYLTLNGNRIIGVLFKDG
jgi:translation initiation factor IF-3